jgi:hypothetical protein
MRTVGSSSFRPARPQDSPEKPQGSPEERDVLKHARRDAEHVEHVL